MGSCNTLNKASNKVCVPNKIKYLNLSMIKGINEFKLLTKPRSCKSKCKFYVRDGNSDQKGNNNNVNVGVKIWKNNLHVEKIIFGIPLHVAARLATI